MFYRILPLLLLGAPALAADGFTQSPAYKECTSLASTNPTLALEKADAWLKIDHGVAANHCRAMALYGLHRYQEAATALASVHDMVPRTDITLRSYVIRQEARAWVNAQRPDMGLAALSGQLSDMGTLKGDNATVARLSAELLLDRARLRETYGQLDDAIQDLDHAVSLSPIDEDVLIERARVFHQLGDDALAKQDLQAVLRGDATQPDALALMREIVHPAPAKPVPLSAPPSAPPAPSAGH